MDKRTGGRVFHPDYISPRKIIVCTCVLVVLIILGLLVASGGELGLIRYDTLHLEDAPIVIGIFVCLVISVVLVIIYAGMKSRNFKDLYYRVNDQGICVVYKNQNQRVISWDEIKEIRVTHGPCEQDSESDAGNYGVYIILESDIKSLYKVKNKILNLIFAPDNLKTIQLMSIVRIYESRRIKRCFEVEEELKNIMETKKENSCRPDKKV